ncbi:MAG: GerMN domain-containing protein [Chloroflexota bacterium]
MLPRLRLGRVPALVVCLLLVAAAGCSCVQRQGPEYVPVDRADAPAGMTRAILWFAAPTGAAVPVTRDLPVGRARTWAAVDALCAGPAADSGLLPTLPPGSRLRKVVYWPVGVAAAAAVDLDFRAPFAPPEAGQTYALSRTLSQFGDIQSARVLVEGVPVAVAGPGSSEGRIDPASVRTILRYSKVTVGSRVYLAADEFAATDPHADFAVIAGQLLTDAYINAMLPRGSEVTWSETPAGDSRTVLVTIRLRRSELSERDWATVQLAADAIALTLRSVPGTTTVTVAVSGQDRVFAYAGSVWPNPER